MSKKKQNGECSSELRMSYAEAVRRNLTKNGMRDRKNGASMGEVKSPSILQKLGDEMKINGVSECLVHSIGGKLVLLAATRGVNMEEIVIKSRERLLEVFSIVRPWSKLDVRTVDEGIFNIYVVEESPTSIRSSGSDTHIDVNENQRLVRHTKDPVGEDIREASVSPTVMRDYGTFNAINDENILSSKKFENVEMPFDKREEGEKSGVVDQGPHHRPGIGSLIPQMNRTQPKVKRLAKKSWGRITAIVNNIETVEDQSDAKENGKTR
ncbi:hypothetical protein Ancab_032125 [Ancistrocladus abbreviatus]